MNITADDLIVKCQKNIPDQGSRIENDDWFYFFTEAIREARAYRTLPWQQRTITMEFFTNIFEYILPSDFDTMIKPHKDKLVAGDEGPFLLYGRDKDFFANNNYGLAVKWERENRTLLAKKDSDKSVLVEGFGDVTTEYTEGGDINNLSTDNVYYKEGASSLRFDITNATNEGSVERTISNVIDITDYINKGYAFLWVYMPTVVPSVTLRYGNDSDNYFSLQVTEDFYENDFQVGWNLLQFSMEDVAETGSVDVTAVDYFKILMDTTGVTDTDFRIDGLTFHIPSLLELPYNSKNTVKDADGVYKEAVTVGTDTILSDETFESVIMWKATALAAEIKMRDVDMTALAKSKHKEKEVNLSRRYPAKVAPLQSNYYSKFNKF